MKNDFGPKKLGDKLKSVRHSKNLSLHAVAKPSKISATYLQKLENGIVKNPSPRVLQRLSEVLSVPYMRLMELVGYVLPIHTQNDKNNQNNLNETLFEDDLTEEERRAVAAFIHYLKKNVRN
ncbi:MAG: helix-turn-helix transcriptional regulator [Candidatus Hatepunaea meridiana]|nr:helix-turn-helix transcriptional regulator [Candidatus Hatepunaea meridiana]